MPPSTHVSLLARLAAPTDDAAWHEFDRRYGPMILSYCLRRGVGFADAEDIRQMVLASLHRTMRGFAYQSERGRFRDYVGRVVANAVSRARGRHAAERARLVKSAAEREEAAGAEEGVDAVWEREWVRRYCRLAMERLRETESARDVEVFERLMAGRPAAEIATDLRLTEEAVRKIKQRVRERLAAFLRACMADEEQPRDERPARD